MHPVLVTSHIDVAAVGASSHAGALLIRLIAGHPEVEIDALYARGQDDVPLANVVDGAVTRPKAAVAQAIEA